MNEIFINNSPIVEKNGEGFSARIKKYKDGKHKGYMVVGNSESSKMKEMLEAFFTGDAKKIKELGTKFENEYQLQKDHYENLNKIIADFIPIEFLKCSK